MEHWYEFTAYNTQKLYGYGPAFAADQYTDHLNKNREINHYAAYQISDEMAAELKLESNTEAFVILDELAEIKDRAA